MPTLQEIRDARLRRENTLNPIVPRENVAENAQRVWDVSVKKNIPLLEADAEVLTQTMNDYQKGLAESSVYKDMDELIDVFDPSEPPKEGAVLDPIAELVKAELAVVGSAVKESLKFFLKGMSYIYSPLDRSFKFGVNALMYEPLLKSVSQRVREGTLRSAIAHEKFRIKQEEAEKIRKEKGLRGPMLVSIASILGKERMAEIDAEVDKRAVDSIKQMQAEDVEGVEVADFLDSAKDAMKALIPWPGAADDVKTFGEISADSYKRIVGREAPLGYASVGDIALQTTAMIGLSKMATNALRKGTQKAVTLTRAEIRAIKRLHKQASQVKKLPVTATGVSSKPDMRTASEKLIALVRSAKSRRPAKEAAIHADRVKKAAKLHRVQKNVEGKQLVSATKKSLAGGARVPDFDPLNVNLSSSEVDTLFNMVNTFDFGGQSFTKGNAILALDDLLHGILITKSQQAGLEQVFGKGLTKALFGKQSVATIIKDVSFEVINLPRALLASFDVSAPGRQGIIFSVSHPIASTKAFGRSIRAAASEKYAAAIEKSTRNSSMGKLADRFGIHSSPTGFTARIGAKEEVYMSRIAESLPFGIGKGVAASERAFTTFLNQQRREVFALQARKWIKRGIKPSNNKKTYTQFAKFVNHATGRGSLENMQPGALTALNAAFFSPRFQVSRVQVIGDLLSPATTLHARKAIARDLAEFYATGMGVMGMARAGGAEMEMNPQSSDFGKIKVGNTRYNYWGSFQPMARLAGQMYTGKIKATGTGKIKDKQRLGLMLNFLRSKLAPTPGRLLDIGLGETARGETVEPTPKFIGKAAYESLIPLFIQDSVDAWRFQGANAQFPASAGLAFTGIGVQTWELALFAQLEIEKDSLSRSTYGKNYDELDYDEVQFLDADIMINHPGIIDLERQVRFESTGVNFLKKQAQEQRRSERRVIKGLFRPVENDFAESRVSIGGVDRIFGNWKLSDEQYKEYEKKVSQEINKLHAEMKPLIDDKAKNDPERYEILSSIVRNAKLLAAQDMKIGSME